MRDIRNWLMRSMLVFHISVEPYCVDRVLSQFGFQQLLSWLIAFNMGCWERYTGNVHFN
jgi:hypothetical protein